MSQLLLNTSRREGRRLAVTPESFGVPQGFAQLHSGRANKRKAIPNFSFPLEGNAAKRQRVYEVKNYNVAPLLLYAGPTLPDLAILCRIAT